MVDETDMINAAAWGGGVAGVGAVAHELQSEKPAPRRQFVAATMIGCLFGATTAAVIRWRFPEVPDVVAILAGGCVGLMSSYLYKALVVLVQRAANRVGFAFDRKLDSVGFKADIQPNTGGDSGITKPHGTAGHQSRPS